MSLKTKNLFKNIMITALLFSFCFLGACKKNEDVSVAEVSADDAADIVASSLSSESAGVAENATTSATVSSYSAAPLGPVKGDMYATTYLCGVQKDSTINFSKSAPNLSASASYVLNWKWILNCTQSIPQSIGFNFSTTGKYTSTRVNSSDQSSGTLTLSNLLSGSTYSLNGSITRTGSTNILVRNKNQFSTNLSITLSNVAVSKTSPYQIQSGTGSFTLTGQDSQGRSINFTGTITFTGNKSATITIAGNTYSTQLYVQL